MVEIRYGEQFETADLAGKSVSEARNLFKAELGIPGKAKAKLNGKNIKEGLESDTCLCDDDKLSFAVSRGKGAFLVGALLLALAITSGVFAYGYITATTTLQAGTITNDFASVSQNGTSTPTWSPYGFYKGTISAGSLFNVDTQTSGYPGNLVVTVSIANADELVEVYRVLALTLEVTADNGSVVDINGSGNVTADDIALLTLNNGSVSLFINQVAADVYNVNIKSGFYITNVFGLGFTSGYEDPLLYAEVAQR